MDVLKYTPQKALRCNGLGPLTQPSPADVTQYRTMPLPAACPLSARFPSSVGLYDLQDVGNGWCSGKWKDAGMSQAWVENVSRVATLCLGSCFSLGLRYDLKICEEDIYDGR
jgi:hypothetical protein